MGITIKSSSCLSQEQIQEMLNQVEKMKNDDLKRKEIIEMKNEGESLIYAIEKQLKEHEKKLTKELQDNIRKEINEFNAVSSQNNHEKLKEVLEKVKNSAIEIGKVLYQNSQEQQQQQQQQKED